MVRCTAVLFRTAFFKGEADLKLPGLFVVALMAAISFLSPTGGHAAAAGPVTRSYVAEGDFVKVICNSTLPVSIGGACFSLPGSEWIDVRADDQSFVPVGFQVEFHGADGRRVGTSIGGCDNGTYAVPPNAVTVGIYMDGPIESVKDCPGFLIPPAATMGTITVGPTIVPTGDPWTCRSVIDYFCHDARGSSPGGICYVWIHPDQCLEPGAGNS